jgi:hypothetical protein
MRIAIFLGPSLPIAEARSILDAVYLPPARQADIATLASRDDKPDVIGLIDGVFMESLSVWHNEILYALQRGVRIYGASSMGALRAAETAVFGMIGVGQIYEMYADGTLEDDDEVALVYGGEELGYLKVSEPMVNIRATLAEAIHRGDIESSVAERAITLAKSIYFADRTIPAMLDLARKSGMPNDQVDGLQRILTEGYVDLKRDDSVALLRTLAALPADGGAHQPSFVFDPSYVFETLYNRDRDVRQGGVELSLARVGNYIALHHPDFDALNSNALNRVMASVLGNLVGVTASTAEIDDERRRFRRRNKLSDDATLAAWCSTNDINAKEFEILMRESAVSRKLHRWLIANRFLDRNTRFLLDYMRVNNKYAEWAERAGDQELTTQRNYPEFPDTGASHPTLEKLILEQSGYTKWAVSADLLSWCEDFGFPTTDDLRLELLRAHLFRQVEARVRAVLLRAAGLQSRKARAGRPVSKVRRGRTIAERSQP